MRNRVPGPGGYGPVRYGVIGQVGYGQVRNRIPVQGGYIVYTSEEQSL